MAIGKKDIKASELIKQAQIDREKRVSEHEGKIMALELKSKAAAERMGKAAEAEELEEYSKAKNEKALADDAIQLYQDKLKALNGSSLFGAESSIMLSKLNAEQKQIEIDAMNEIIPLLTKAWGIADKARADYLAAGELISVVTENTGINTTGKNPDDVVGLMRSIGYYTDPHTRETKGWK